MRLAFIMQYSAFDFDQMRRTCRLIAAMEPEMNKEIDFIFSVKYGAPVDNQTLALIGEKFPVIVFKGNRRDEGWPDGPSAQWCETMDWAYREVRPMYAGVGDGKRKWDYLFTTEPDICPLEIGWLQLLKDFVEQAGTPVVGMVQAAPAPHVNGNAFFKPDWAFQNRMNGAPTNVAWDMHWAPQNLAAVTDCPLMKNLYNPNREWCNEEVLYTPRAEGFNPVYVHGIKGNCALDLVATKFGIDLNKSLTTVRS